MKLQKNNEFSVEELYRISKTFENLTKMEKKYKNIQQNMIVMDDYDGGQMNMVNLIVKDLKNLKKGVDKSEKSVIL
tara:strand:+ start:540 stop:767 length:228 start_codon:yes stop_codon:yes gene_type:complete